jgi:hypothetical protein
LGYLDAPGIEPLHEHPLALDDREQGFSLGGGEVEGLHGERQAPTSRAGGSGW